MYCATDDKRRIHFKIIFKTLMRPKQLERNRTRDKNLQSLTLSIPGEGVHTGGFTSGTISLLANRGAYDRGGGA